MPWPIGRWVFACSNNIAVGASLALAEFDLARVLIVDWDVHHGNGTQAIFWEEPARRLSFDSSLALLSGHRPGGRNRRRPRPWERRSICRSNWALRGENTSIACGADLELLADKIRPELVLVSAGFDAHRDDPIGSLGLETEDFRPADPDRASAWPTSTPRGGVVSVLEGGYDLTALADSCQVHVEELLGTP